LSSSRILIRGAVLALVAAILALAGGALGIDTLWPVLLAAAVGVAAASSLSVGRGAAFIGGALIGWVAMAIRAGLLPDTAFGRAIVVVLAIAVITAIAAATADLAPMWAGLAGYALFAAYYEPVYTASPTTFVADSTAAMVTVLLATAFGFGAALLGDLAASFAAGTSSESAAPSTPVESEVTR
jgi:hypothetical protein